MLAIASYLCFYQNCYLASYQDIEKIIVIIMFISTLSYHIISIIIQHFIKGTCTVCTASQLTLQTNHEHNTSIP